MKIYDKNKVQKDKSWWDYGESNLPEANGLIPIFETDEKIDIQTVLIISGKAYVACVTYKDIFAFVQELKVQKVFIENAEPIPCKYTNDVKCPFCGYEESDSWELEDGEDEHECGNCGSIFSFRRIVTVEYCSEPVKKSEALNLDDLNSRPE